MLKRIIPSLAIRKAPVRIDGACTGMQLIRKLWIFAAVLLVTNMGSFAGESVSDKIGLKLDQVIAEEMDSDPLKGRIGLTLSEGGVKGIAQDTIKGKIGLTLSGGGAKGFAQIGVLHVIDSLGLPQLHQQVPTFSYSGSVLLDKLILGGEGNLYFSRNKYHPQILLQKNGGSGGIYGGFLLGRKHGRMLYPTLGIGYVGDMTHFSPCNGETITVAEVTYAQSLRSPGHYLPFPLKMNIDIFTGNPGTPGLMMGITMGYVYRHALTSPKFTDIYETVLPVNA